MEEHLNFLEVASSGDWPKLRETLQTRNIDVNFQHKINGWSALHWACKRGHKKAVKVLLEAGARKDLCDAQGRTPAQVCTDSSVLELLGEADPVREKKNAGPKSEETGFVPNYIANPPFIYAKKDKTPTDPVPSRAASLPSSAPIPETRSQEQTMASDGKRRILLRIPGEEEMYKETVIPTDDMEGVKEKVKAALKMEQNVLGLLRLSDKVLIGDSQGLESLADLEKVAAVANKTASSDSSPSKVLLDNWPLLLLPALIAVGGILLARRNGVL